VDVDRRSPGIRAIVTYKMTKAMLQLLLAGTLVALGTDRVQPAVAALAAALRHHATEGWSVALAFDLSSLVTTRRLFITCAALAGDGLLSGVEGILLKRGVSWAPWLVVAVTAALLPWELWAIATRPQIGRMVLFLVNASIVGYLIKHALVRSSPRPQLA
jgi:uncharacterized membrane protein (DUF2068 family)